MKKNTITGLKEVTTNNANNCPELLNDGIGCNAKAEGNIEDARRVHPFIIALKDEHEEVRIAAAEALGEIGDTRAVEPLIAAFNDKDNDIYGAALWGAAWALGEIGDTRAVEPLIAALKNEHKIVRKLAAKALVKMYRDGNLNEHSKKRILAEGIISTEDSGQES